jgi:hypothetical protein
MKHWLLILAAVAAASAILFLGLYVSSMGKNQNCVCTPNCNPVQTFNPNIHIGHSANQNEDAAETEVDDDAESLASEHGKAKQSPNVKP